MTFTRRPKQIDTRIDDEAAEWVVRLEDTACSPGPKEQARWFAWLRRSPHHVQAYFDTADLFERLERMDPQARIDVDDWLAQRRAPVVSIATADSVANVRTKAGDATATSGKRWRIATLAASIGTVAMLAGVFAPDLVPFAGVHRYQTAIGEQKSAHLDDGSVMDLNTRSRARVAFSRERRLVELHGEALFTVAHDPQRPFYVRTATATILAVGTKFNVYEERGATRVAVVEGIVKVTPDVTSGVSPDSERGSPDSFEEAAVSLSAGEAVRVSRGVVDKQRAPNVKATIAWQRRQLVFVDAPLAEVAAQFNRYNERQIEVDATIGNGKRLSATFDALQPQSLLLYLRKDPSLSVAESTAGVTVRQVR